MREQWRRCPSRPGVEASSLGRVRIGSRIVEPEKPNAGGYLRVHINGERVYLHHLCCEAFHGKRPPGMLALHRDDEKANNTPGNLRWGTQRDNGLDCSRNGNAKHQRLTPAQVRAIRASSQPHTRVALEFGVTYEAVRKIRIRERWTWL